MNAKGGAVMGFIRFPLCPVVDIKNGFERLKLAARPFGWQPSGSLLSLLPNHLPVVLLTT
jgi:hypothetical protein